MSYATGTTHYNLPQTVGTDKRDWADTNQAFSDIDAAIYGAVSDVATAGTAISGLETRMTTAEGNITDNAANITSLYTRMTTAEGAITSLSSRVDDVGNDLGDMICAYNEPTATSTHDYAVGDYFRYNDVLYRATQSIAIGDTIVPDTNCTTTNVSAELLDIRHDIPTTDEFMTNDAFCDYTEDNTIATRNYSIGDTILINHEGYIVTDAITSGSTISGSNSTKFKFGSKQPVVLKTITPDVSDNLNSALVKVLNYIENIPDAIIRDVKFVVNNLQWNVTGSSATYINVSSNYMVDTNTASLLFATYSRSTHALYVDGVYSMPYTGTAYSTGHVSAVNVIGEIKIMI